MMLMGMSLQMNMEEMTENMMVMMAVGMSLEMNMMER